MKTFDKSIIELYKQGFIAEDTVMTYASKKNIVGRGIDVIKSAKGEKTKGIAGLSMDRDYERTI